MNARVKRTKSLNAILAYTFCILVVLNCTEGYAQQSKIIDLKIELEKNKDDTVKIILYEKLGQAYRDENKPDSSILCYQQALHLNQSINYLLLKQCLDIGTIDYLYYTTGNYLKSLEYAAQQLILGEQLNDTSQMGFAHAVFAHNFKALGEYGQALDQYFKARQIFKSYFDVRNLPEDDPYITQCIADVYLKMNKMDSALLFTQLSLTQRGTDAGNLLYSIRILGDIYLAKNDDRALNCYRDYIILFIKYNKPVFGRYKQNSRDLGFVYNSMAKIFQKKLMVDSAVYYGKLALENATKYQDQENIYYAANTLYSLYSAERNSGLPAGADNKTASSFTYFKIATVARDSMEGVDKLRQIQILSFNERMREKEQAAIEAKKEARIRLILIISAIVFGSGSILLWNRIRQLSLRHKMILEQREVEKLKATHEKQLLELEAKALRAQMNPHFIFNCLNSIKSLIQQHNEYKAVTYLTTFSKLIRSLFVNADKKEISLFDEIETCKLYLQLEMMRFDEKYSSSVNIDNTIDLKSVLVPALILQPFLENAIWHGIIPRNNSGHISLTLNKCNDIIEIVIEDDGIGREASQQNKSGNSPAHQSKGINLTQSRLELDNLLRQRQAAIVTIDKKDEAGNVAGTKVIIRIKEET